MQYKPSSYLVRLSSAKKGEAVLATTFENNDAAVASKIKEKAFSIAEMVLDGHLDARSFQEVEILRGETINKFTRMESMLEQCRNLLIDLDGVTMSQGLRLIYDAVMDDFDEQAGL